MERVRPDWIAVDLGTVHKSLAKRPLDLERLRDFASLGKPVVLHGGSSARTEDLERAVALGVAKVNVATRAFAAFTEGVTEGLGHSPPADPRAYLAWGGTAWPRGSGISWKMPSL